MLPARCPDSAKASERVSQSIAGAHSWSRLTTSRKAHDGDLVRHHSPFRGAGPDEAEGAACVEQWCWVHIRADSVLQDECVKSRAVATLCNLVALVICGAATVAAARHDEHRAEGRRGARVQTDVEGGLENAAVTRVGRAVRPQQHAVAGGGGAAWLCMGPCHVVQMAECHRQPPPLLHAVHRRARTQHATACVLHWRAPRG